jgi:hypothetical protein
MLPLPTRKKLTTTTTTKSKNVEKILVLLRDGKKLIGVLRSYNQFGDQNNTTDPFLKNQSREGSSHKAWSIPPASPAYTHDGPLLTETQSD